MIDPKQFACQSMSVTCRRTGTFLKSWSNCSLESCAKISMPAACCPCQTNGSGSGLYPDLAYARHTIATALPPCMSSWVVSTYLKHMPTNGQTTYQSLQICHRTIGFSAAERISMQPICQGRNDLLWRPRLHSRKAGPACVPWMWIQRNKGCNPP